MSAPNYRISPAASRQRHHDSGYALLVVGMALGMVILSVIFALALILAQIVG
jgi:hypothetical protein